MGETVVVRQAGPEDIAAAAEIWYASHLARRGGRALPKERHDLAHERMAAPDGLLLIAEEFGTPDGPEPGGSQAGGLHTGGPHAAGPHAAGSHAAGPGPGHAVPPPVVGSVLGEPGREDDGAGPPVPGLLHIALVSVHPDRWGQHVGRLLLEALLDRAPALGYRHAQLWAHADNTRANRLYRATGFRRTGRAHIDQWGEFVVHYQRSVQDHPSG
ncbi:GNAT family N-acetyltransferase [Peterkaempfera bronchialis]|uniref:GNAT family N-acetyltransferase n=1 Tax=Peterkaempfera bronchialis TaxID=2126346 RepID=UPI003C2B589A